MSMPLIPAPIPSSPLAPGDVVFLKSGGPAMTVVEVAPSHVTCAFFTNDQNQIIKAMLPAETLRRRDDSARSRG